MYLHACGEERDDASESTDSPTTSSNNDPEVIPTAKMIFSPKKTHPTLHPPSNTEQPLRLSHLTYVKFLPLWF